MNAEAPPRVAAVTGASSGIGQAVAIALGRLGWQVAVGARRADRLAHTACLVEEAGGTALAHELDVTDPASVDAFFDAADDAFGPGAVAVHNAGVSTPGPFHTLDPADLRREVETNLLGVLLTARRSIRTMLEHGITGDQVFLSSDAVRDGRPRMIAYAATKAGVEVAARSLTMELEGTGIRCTTVRVGPTFTEFLAGVEPEELGELLEYWPRFGLQRHMAVMTPDDVARAVVLAVTTPPGVFVGTIEVQPSAPATPG